MRVTGCTRFSLLLLTCLPTGAFALETDNFTHRDRLTKDATRPIENFAKRQILAGINGFNRGDGDCREDIRRTDPRLYANIYSAFRGLPFSKLDRWAVKPEIPVDTQTHFAWWMRDYDYLPYEYRTRVPVEESIFAVWSSTERMLIQHDLVIAPTVRLGEFRTGMDKLAHFFKGHDEWKSFQKFIANGSASPLISMIEEQVELEKGDFGGEVSAIISYGDLAADLAGFIYYRRLLHGENPYIVCKNDGNYAFSQTARFELSDYVNYSWDEALNCSQYVSQERTEKIEAHLKSRGTQCPAEDRNLELEKIPCGQWILNPRQIESPNRECSLEALTEFFSAK